MWAYVTILAGFAAFLSFTWGLNVHFRAEGGMPDGMKWLTRASTAGFILFVGLTLWHAPGTPQAIWATAFFLMAGIIFWWAVQTTRKGPPAVAYSNAVPHVLYKDGPYAYVRHPFYLSYCIGWIGTAIAAGPVQWFVAGIIILWYYRTARTEEKQICASEVAEEYARYRKKTALILPFIL